MLAFVTMSRPWIWAFAVAITALLVLAAIVVAVPTLKKHVNLVAAALALWSFFYFYAVLAHPRGAVTFDAAWWAAHKKALAAFITNVVVGVTALISLGVLPDPWAHNVAVALVALGPLLAFLGVKIAPANAPQSKAG